MKNYKFLWILLWVPTMLMQACENGPARPNEQPEALVVGIVKAQTQPFEITLDVTGNILPYEQVELKAPLGGTVMHITFEEGQTIKKGQTLIQIDDRAWQAEAKGLRSRIAVAKRDLERSKSLLEIEGASQENVDAAQATLSDLEAQLQQMEVNISLANVRAPFSGVVGMRNFSMGAYLSQGAAITEITQLDRLKVNFDVPSRYGRKIAEGDVAQIHAGKDTIQAVIYAINPSVKNTSRTLQVRAEVQGAEGRLQPGEFAEVQLQLAMDSIAILIPTEAIIPELNKQTLFVIKKQIAHKKTVQLGSRTPSEVQILKGITPGDSVIISGLLQVKDGMKVDAKMEEDTP